MFSTVFHDLFFKQHLVVLLLKLKGFFPILARCRNWPDQHFQVFFVIFISLNNVPDVLSG